MTEPHSKTNLRAGIGSNTPVGTLQLTLFVPGADRDGNEIDQEGWVEAALTAFGMLFRGATAFPPGRGVWRDDDRAGTLVFDETVMVISYVDPSLVTDRSLAQLRLFLHRMGREARQGEIGIVIDRGYHGITEYDEEP